MEPVEDTVESPLLTKTFSSFLSSGRICRWSVVMPKVDSVMAEVVDIVDR